VAQQLNRSFTKLRLNLQLVKQTRHEIMVQQRKL